MLATREDTYGLDHLIQAAECPGQSGAIGQSGTTRRSGAIGQSGTTGP